MIENVEEVCAENSVDPLGNRRVLSERRVQVPVAEASKRPRATRPSIGGEKHRPERLGDPKRIPKEVQTCSPIRGIAIRADAI